MLSNLLRISCLFALITPLSWAAGGGESDTNEYQLSNGLELIVREDHHEPTVAHMVQYRVGSMDEVNGRTGVAHVLEHMMLKGADKVKLQNSRVWSLPLVAAKMHLLLVITLRTFSRWKNQNQTMPFGWRQITYPISILMMPNS